MYSRRKSAYRSTQSVYNTRMSRAQSCNKEVKKKPAKEVTPTKELSLPSVETIDREKHLPCYSSILSRSIDDCIGMEDLDRLQQELELMLSSVVVRSRTLQAEVELINTTQESKPRRTQVQLSKLRKRKIGGSGSWTGSQSETNDGFQSDEDWSDEEKESDHEDEEFCRKVGRTPRRAIPLVPPSVVPVSRNDVPNNYWAYVDQYCPEIIQDDIKFLEEVINTYDRFEEEGNLGIPELGKHFSQLEIKQENKENSLESSWKTSHSDQSQAAKAKMPGTTMQSMACALVESPSSPNSKTKKTKDTETGTSESRCLAILSPNVLKQSDERILSLPSSHNFVCFEEKLLLFMRKLGWLEDEPTKDPDEILTDLKRCKNEILSLMRMNKSWLYEMTERCRVQLSREEINKDIEKINNEIIDVCHKNVTLHSRKKHLCKKEAEECWKLLKEREKLIKSLKEI